jgi:hypothetical protein
VEQAPLDDAFGADEVVVHRILKRRTSA